MDKLLICPYMYLHINTYVSYYLSSFLLRLFSSLSVIFFFFSSFSKLWLSLAYQESMPFWMKRHHPAEMLQTLSACVASSLSKQTSKYWYVDGGFSSWLSLYLYTGLNIFSHVICIFNFIYLWYICICLFMYVCIYLYV